MLCYPEKRDGSTTRAPFLFGLTQRSTWLFSGAWGRFSLGRSYFPVCITPERSWRWGSGKKHEKKWNSCCFLIPEKAPAQPHLCAGRAHGGGITDGHVNSCWNLSLCIAKKFNSLTTHFGVDLRLIHHSYTRPCSSLQAFEMWPSSAPKAEL